MWVSTVLSDRTKHIRQVSIHLLCLLQQFIHLLGQWDVMRKVFCLLGAFQTWSGAWDDQQVLLPVDLLPLQTGKCSYSEEGHEQELKCHDRLNMP